VSDRESEIERICQAALDCPPEERAALLLQLCGGDESTRREVEGLLAFEATADRFMETPAQGYLGCCDAIRELDYSRQLSEIRAPTLVIAGREDASTSLAPRMIGASNPSVSILMTSGRENRG